MRNPPKTMATATLPDGFKGRRGVHRSIYRVEALPRPRRRWVPASHRLRCPPWRWRTPGERQKDGAPVVGRQGGYELSSPGGVLRGGYTFDPESHRLHVGAEVVAVFEAKEVAKEPLPLAQMPAMPRELRRATYTHGHDASICIVVASRRTDDPFLCISYVYI